MIEKKLKNLCKAALHVYSSRRLHAEQNARAAAAYRAIVSRNPSHALSEAQRRVIRQYSRDVFGSFVYAPWLEVLSAYRGKFLEGWIPSNYYVGVLVPLWTRYQNIDAKIITRRILGTDQIPDVGYFFNGFWLDRDHHEIPAAQLRDRLFSKSNAVFVKLDISMQGLGVRKVTRSEFDPERLSKLGDFVVQSPIQQHPFFDRFTSDSVATLRITTVKEPGRAAVKKASYLRLARSGAAYVRSDASIRIAVIDDQGTLDSRGADSSWASFTAHPDSKVEFSGRVIPGFKHAVALCEKLHDKSPVSALIGWDVAIDPLERPVLMEWNQGRADIKFSEASVGPCFKGLGWEKVWRNQQTGKNATSIRHFLRGPVKDGKVV